MEQSPPSRSEAPAVVAVVVTRDPGPWFEESMAALAAQDYPNLAVLFLDSASDADPTERIASVLPSAFVRRLDENRGFGWAANHVSEIVDGAAFFCFLHDDAAPRPDALQVMVNEALRSNAGIVGAKLVDFNDPSRLLGVGDAIDKTGERSSPIDPGELDQEQHDAVRDVFVASGGCLLVRSDLFTAIGGFDPGIDLLNDDLDLCWRAHVAGARVVVAPDAVVRHAEALGERSDADLRRERLLRHRIRTMLACYSRWHRWRVVPQAALVSLLEVVYAMVVGRRDQAGHVIAAWRWNWERRGEIAARRAQIEAFRGVPDAEVRDLQLRGSARLTAFLRGQGSRGGTRSDRAQAAWHDLLAAYRRGELTWPLGAWIVTTVVVVFGSRHLLLQPIAGVGGFLPVDGSTGELLSGYVRDRRTIGLGVDTPAPTVQAMVGLLSVPLLGAVGLARTVLLLGPILVGLVGAYRVTRPLGSRTAQAAALVVYGATPVAFDAVADARWSSLVVYAAVPWTVAALARAAGWEPFARPGDPHGRRSALAGPALVVAVVVAFEPTYAVLVVWFAACTALGGVLARSGRGGLRAVSAAAAIGAGGVVLNLPWLSAYLLPTPSWDALVGSSASSSHEPLLDLLRFGVGPVGSGTLSLGLPLAAALPLIIGREWRFEWAVRAWTLTVGLIALVWLDGRGWLPVAMPPAETLMAGAAFALGLAAAMGVIAFEIDLRAYGFGWRQIASAAALAAVVLGALPTLLDAGNGRWYHPSGGLGSTFAFMDEEAPGFRVLWIGHPDVLPAPGFALRAPGVTDTAFVTSQDGLPTLGEGWPGRRPAALDAVEEAVAVAVAGETSRAGALLAPFGVRYLVLPLASAPSPLGGVERPIPAAVVGALSEQLDLVEVAVNPAYVVFRNEAQTPSTMEHPTTSSRDEARAVSPIRLAVALVQLAAWSALVIVARRDRRGGAVPGPSDGRPGVADGPSDDVEPDHATDADVPVVASVASVDATSSGAAAATGADGDAS